MLHAGHLVGTMEAAEAVAPTGTAASSAPTSLVGLIPEHLSPVQWHQLMQLLEQHWVFFS